MRTRVPKQLIAAGMSLALAASAGALRAQDLAPSEIDVSALGPQVGDIVPDFSLPDQSGEIRTRESIMGPRGAMLVFVRSADW
jgi:hypothetical protein